MWTRKLLMLGSISTAVAIAAACDTDYDQRPSSPATAEDRPVDGPADRPLDNTALTGRVKAALVRDAGTKASDINVESNNGVVVLSGFVATQDEKAAAERSARTVDGVKDLENRLSVRNGDAAVRNGDAAGRNGDGTASAPLDDSMVTAKVKAALVAEPRTSAMQINVETKGGVVQLSGFVDTAEEKAKAADVARGIQGVTDVQNRIDVKAK